MSIKGSLIFPLMKSAYNFNLYINGKFSGSLEWLLYTGLAVIMLFRHYVIVQGVEIIFYDLVWLHSGSWRPLFVSPEWLHWTVSDKNNMPVHLYKCSPEQLCYLYKTNLVMLYKQIGRLLIAHYIYKGFRCS